MAKSFLDGLLGGVQSLTGGKSAADLTQTAKDSWNSQSTLTKGAIAGGILGILLSGNARRMLGAGAKVGGAAVIGGLAYKAYEDWKAGKAAQTSSPDQPLELPHPSDAFLPHDQDAADDLSYKLLQAMIAAAKADGQVTPQERARITEQLPRLALGERAQAMLTDQLDTPLDIAGIASLATSEAQAVEIYAASLLVVDPQGGAEKGYLAMLAARLNLDPGLVAHLHARAGSVA